MVGSEKAQNESNQIAIDPEFEDLLDFIQRSKGFDFKGYKRATLKRRVTRRMQEVHMTSFDDYRALLETNDDEFEQLFSTVLINVTSFLRDRSTWDYLRSTVVPRIVAEKASNEPIRVWSAGCASGEEAFSIAMLFAEACGEKRFVNTVKIYATDLDEDALNEGRMATYRTKDIVDAVPEDLRARYFKVGDSVALFRKDLRRQVIFGRNDLLLDPPISRLDLLLCRNTLMYFNADVQNRVLDNFHFALRDGGYLLLGKSEVLLTRDHIFKPVDLKRRLFVKAPGPRRLRKRAPLSNSDSENQSYIAGPPDLIEATFEWAGNAEIVLDKQQKLTAINSSARSMFELTHEHLGSSLKDLEMSYRPVELRSRVEQAEKDGYPVVIRDVRLLVGPEADQYVDVQITPLLSAGGEYIGATLVFNDVTRFRDLQDQLEVSKHELENAYEELQSTVEELETTNEELQSTNEELETTNEELQSTNEELETMNEELQSSNEELETINDELRSRTEDLNNMNGFLESILGSLDSAVVVVGKNLEVMVWSSNSEDLWGVRSDEVIGRNFLALSIGLPVERLSGALKNCLNGADSTETVSVPAVNRKGRNLNCRVRVSALHSGFDNEITGAIVMVDSIDGNVSDPPDVPGNAE